MGSTGAFLSKGGFIVYEWETVKTIHEIKVLEKIDKTPEPSLPYLSNTPGTAYIQLKPNGTFDQFRQYGEDRRPLFDIDYEIHSDNDTSLHIHYFIYGKRTKYPDLIASKNLGIINMELYNKYKPIFVGVKL